jgi:hypothetical protein
LQQPIYEFYALFGGEPYLHKRKLIRYVKPHDANSTGARYDLTYLPVPTKSRPAGIPIGDIPVKMGDWSTSKALIRGDGAWKPNSVPKTMA